jgi:hypothetical protein
MVFCWLLPSLPACGERVGERGLLKRVNRIIFELIRMRRKESPILNLALDLHATGSPMHGPPDFQQDTKEK